MLMKNNFQSIILNQKLYKTFLKKKFSALETVITRLGPNVACWIDT